jgi:hypothetical protein
MIISIKKVPFNPHPDGGWYITITFKVEKFIDCIDRYTEEPRDRWNLNEKRIQDSDPLLRKLNKDTYEYSCPVTNLGVTRGVIQDIEALPSTQWEEEDYLILIKYLSTLDTYWD